MIKHNINRNILGRNTDKEVMSCYYCLPPRRADPSLQRKVRYKCSLECGVILKGGCVSQSPAQSPGCPIPHVASYIWQGGGEEEAGLVLGNQALCMSLCFLSCVLWLECKISTMFMHLNNWSPAGALFWDTVGIEGYGSPVPMAWAYPSIFLHPDLLRCEWAPSLSHSHQHKMWGTSKPYPLGGVTYNKAFLP
jgi:hypothetical protein